MESQFLITMLHEKLLELEADKARLIKERDEAEKALREYGHYDEPRSGGVQWAEYQ